MNNNKFKFRTPWYLGDKFAGFQYWEFEHGQVKLIGDYWEPWVSKQDILTAKPDEQCTGLRDKNGNLIYKGDILNAMCFEPDCEWHGCLVKVIWDKTAFQFLIFGERPYQSLPFDQVMYNAENDGFELIGNIHEQAKQKD